MIPCNGWSQLETKEGRKEGRKKIKQISGKKKRVKTSLLAINEIELSKWCLLSLFLSLLSFLSLSVNVCNVSM